MPKITKENFVKTVEERAKLEGITEKDAFKEIVKDEITQTNKWVETPTDVNEELMDEQGARDPNKRIYYIKKPNGEIDFHICDKGVQINKKKEHVIDVFPLSCHREGLSKIDGSCIVCMEFATKICSKCKIAHYCEREHQRDDWKRHKKLCGILKSYANNSDGVYDANDDDDVDR